MVEMLPDLLIAGFRAFKHLEIEKLGRVNLITGKNNSGKSCLPRGAALICRRRQSYRRTASIPR